MYSAAVRLAAMLSLVAAVVVLALDSLVDVSGGALVAAVTVVGFATSWVLTGRINRSQVVVADRPRHRVVVVPVAHRV